MQVFTAKQLHDNPSEVYRAAVKGPVKITHKHHGEMILSSADRPHFYVYKRVADEELCVSGPEALNHTPYKSAMAIQTEISRYSHIELMGDKEKLSLLDRIFDIFNGGRYE